MSKKVSNKTANLNVRITDNVNQIIKEIAEKEEVKDSVIIRELILAGLQSQYNITIKRA